MTAIVIDPEITTRVGEHERTESQTRQKGRRARSLTEHEGRGSSDPVEHTLLFIESRMQILNLSSETSVSLLRQNALGRDRSESSVVLTASAALATALTAANSVSRDLSTLSAALSAASRADAT